MNRCDICDKLFIRCDNMLRHIRTVHSAGDQEWADKDFDSDFEHDDGMDTDEEALYQEKDSWS